ncbi:hypothetical protein ACFYZ8_33150 [Streptomyces sp. NPDC001668]|uniref:hypothetical protein n=1 Tax=Streptomyces sp. NPDC001668 TaxID=3364598 RepID=UPI00368DFF48
MTTIAEYQDLITEHASLRALRIRINGAGVMPDADVEARANGVIACAMEEAESASRLSPRQISLLAPGLRASIARMTAGPEESHADAMARGWAAALRLRAG